MPEDNQTIPGELTATSWLNEILKASLQQGASDVHIVPENDRMVTYFRVDGVMRMINEWQRENHETVLARIKVVSGMRVVEKTQPQDGHLEIIINMSEKGDGNTMQMTANFRVSVMPTIYGETAVLRALNRKSSSVQLTQLGLSTIALPVVQRLAQIRHGMTLLTGPTGSGKTTTLYSLLKRTASSENTVLTLEDPVEYSLEGVRQTQIKSTGGLTFSTGLKALLRQDPDVVMIGEIRDEETADISIRAALSGRLVFSTFHTNDISGVILRFMDMDIPRSLIASALSGIISQRLVRKICNKCRVPVEVPWHKLKLLNITQWPEGKSFSGKGCEACGGTGFQGRVAIFEVYQVSDTLRNMIIQRTSFEKIINTINEELSQSMLGDGFEKAQNGITSIEEVIHAVI